MRLSPAWMLPSLLRNVGTWCWLEDTAGSSFMNGFGAIYCLLIGDGDSQLHGGEMPQILPDVSKDGHWPMMCKTTSVLWSNIMLGRCDTMLLKISSGFDNVASLICSNNSTVFYFLIT